MFGTRVIVGVILLTLRLVLAPTASHAQECRDVWLEGKENLNEYEKFVYVKGLSATRELTAKQKDCLLRMSDRLLDNRLGDFERRGVADWLATMGHVYCIPPLLAVVRNPRDNGEVRACCVRALGKIADKRVMDPIIDALGDEENQLAGAAWQELVRMFTWTRPGPDVPPPPGVEKGLGAAMARREETRDQWRAWWAKYGDRIPFDPR